MGLPRSKEARLFYQVAQQRFLDAGFLLDNGRTTGAVYLAGYSVECIFKALILSRLADSPRRLMEKSFRGSKAHDFEWLRSEYAKSGGQGFPPKVVQALARVITWNTTLRYRPGTIPLVEANAFFEAAKILLTLADTRL